MSKNRAWFLSDDGRAPSTLYIMYNHEQNKPWSTIDFKEGKEYDLNEIGTLIFNVTDNKWGKPEHIYKWDFLPNSTGIPFLANERAIKVLEDFAPNQFQVIPTELHMPDGSVIRDYKLLNITQSVPAIDYSKCILEKEKFRLDFSPYKTLFCYRDCLEDNLHLATIRDKFVFLGSEALRKEIKKNKLYGLTFKKDYARKYFFIEDQK